MKIEIQELPPSKITSQLLLELAANSQKVTFTQYLSSIRLCYIEIYILHLEILFTMMQG
jgi:hypothetical protein